jgi:hypothetical protein
MDRAAAHVEAFNTAVTTGDTGTMQVAWTPDGQVATLSITFD